MHSAAGQSCRRWASGKRIATGKQFGRAPGWSIVLGLLVSACDAAGSADSTASLPPATTSIAAYDTSGSIPASSVAWWLWSRFTPTGAAVEGIAVAQLDSTWVRASRLGRAALPPESQANPGTLPDSTVDFVQDGDFNQDGSPDRALVGVFETRAGARGQFLLVLTRESGQWQRAFLRQTGPDPGFSVLRRDSVGLTLWSCMECDSYAALRWTGTAYELVAEACCGEPALDTTATTRAARDRPRRSAVFARTMSNRSTLFQNRRARREL